MVIIGNYRANGKALATDKKVLGTIWRWNRYAGDKPIQVSQPDAARLLHVGERTFRDSVDRLKEVGWLWTWRYGEDRATYYVPHCGLLQLIYANRRNRTGYKNITVTRLGSPVCMWDDGEVCFCLSMLKVLNSPKRRKKIRHPPYW